MSGSWKFLLSLDEYVEMGTSGCWALFLGHLASDSFGEDYGTVWSVASAASVGSTTLNSSLTNGRIPTVFAIF